MKFIMKNINVILCNPSMSKQYKTYHMRKEIGKHFYGGRNNLNS
jgi:hypothetical protein